MMKIAALLFSALLVSGMCSADAQSGSPDLLFENGHFVEAFEAAETGTADGHAFRAKALLAKAIFESGTLPEDTLNQALAEANAAIALDQTHTEGRLQKAIAQSLKTRAMSARQVRSSGLGPQSRDAVEALIAEDETNAYAHMFLSVWHLEVYRRGGRVGAMVMGASRKEARQHYKAAAALAGNDVSIHWQYARALTALDSRKYRDEIDTVLQRALEAECHAALDVTMQARAENLRNALKEHSSESVEMIAAAMH